MEKTAVSKPLSSRPLRWLVWSSIGLLFIGWLFNTPAGLLGKADAVGYAVCHRIDTRSFHLGERQIPLCARCSGMYLGAMLGLVYQEVTGRRRTGTPPWKVLVVLGFLGLGFAIDGINSFAHLIPGAPFLYEPSNGLRLLTGTGMGLVMSAAVYPSFHQTVWTQWDPRPAIPGLGQVAVLILSALVLDALVWTENPLVLYPLALVSAGGVLVLLTMVYTILGLILLRQENRVRRAKQLVIPLFIAFGVSLSQVALFDLVRFALTGTWGGFPLPL